MHKNQTAESVEREAEQLREKELQTVRELLNEASVKYRDVTANEILILSVCERPVDYIKAAVAFERVKHQLTPGPAYQRAYQEFFEARPELFVQANIELLDSLWNFEYELNCDGLLALAAHENVKGRLCFTQAYADVQREQQHRAELIRAISLGKPTYACTSNNDSRITNYPSVELAGETTERLEEILAIVTEYRRLQSMSVEDIKKQRRLDEIAKGRAQNIRELPTHWTPLEDGNFSNVGPAIIAGQPVVLNPETFRRLSVADIRKLLAMFGGDLVNTKLVGTKPRTQYGSEVIIRA